MPPPPLVAEPAVALPLDPAGAPPLGTPALATPPAPLALPPIPPDVAGAPAMLAPADPPIPDAPAKVAPEAPLTVGGASLELAPLAQAKSVGTRRTIAGLLTVSTTREVSSG